jgi:hypothetical protein
MSSTIAAISSWMASMAVRTTSPLLAQSTSLIFPQTAPVEAVQPFFACQSVVRDQTRHEYTRHMIRLRHEAQIGTKEAKEVVVVNAHDRYSAYNMMAGVLSPMAQHGRIPRDPRKPRTRNTAPW